MAYREARIEFILALSRVLVGLGALATFILGSRGGLLAGPTVWPGDPLARAWVGAAATVVYVGASVLIYRRLVLRRSSIAPAQRRSLGVDLSYAIVVALLTDDGHISVLFPTWWFVVLAMAFRGDFAKTCWVVALCATLSTAIGMLAGGLDGVWAPAMRGVQLLVGGVMAALLGLQREELEQTVLELERTRDRGRIAAQIHDGILQTLASVNVQLGTCGELLSAGRVEAVREVQQSLRDEVRREYRTVRGLMREVAGQADTALREASPCGTKVNLELRVQGEVGLIADVLSIVTEGLENVRRHAHAEAASLAARGDASAVVVTMEDDGVGFPRRGDEPWSIAARARARGGSIRISPGKTSGSRVEVSLPRSVG